MLLLLYLTVVLERNNYDRKVVKKKRAKDG